MTHESPTAQSGPIDLDRLIRVGDLPAPITNPEAWPTGYADGFNDYARMVAQTAPTQSTPAGARDAVTDAAVSLRGLAGVIRKHRTCAPSALEVVAERLEAITGKADGECRYCGDTGYFYSEPEFGPCSCPLGKVTQPSEDRQDMKDRLLAALESSAAYQSALVAIGDLAASCADGNALAEALTTIESISNHAIGREATQPAASGLEDAAIDAKAKEMFDDYKDALAAPWERQWNGTRSYWRQKAIAALAAQSAPVVGDALAELIAAVEQYLTTRIPSYERISKAFKAWKSANG